MKHIAFQYTDTKNITKNRAVLVLQEPNKYVTGYDVIELSEEDVGRMSVALGKAQDAYKLEMARIADEFDCNKAYRQFLPERMQDVVSEYL